MPTYEYEIISTKEVVEVMQGIKEDVLKEVYSPKKKKMLPCKRLISLNVAGVIYQGDGWTVKSSGYGKRGYKGKFQDKIRDSGTPVDAPAHKTEADRFFQQQIDNGMLDSVAPSMTMGTQTTEQMLDKKYKPK